MATRTITLRNNQADPLTFTELDNNIDGLDTDLATVEGDYVSKTTDTTITAELTVAEILSTGQSYKTGPTAAITLTGGTGTHYVNIGTIYSGYHDLRITATGTNAYHAVKASIIQGYTPSADGNGNHTETELVRLEKGDGFLEYVNLFAEWNTSDSATIYAQITAPPTGSSTYIFELQGLTVSTSNTLTGTSSTTSPGLDALVPHQTIFAGNVGIGTSAPSYDLSVVGSSAAIQIDNTAGSPDQTLMLFQADMGTNDRNFQIKSPATDSNSAPFRFTTGNSFAFEIDSITDAFVIDASANVGIGVTPTNKLDIYNDGFVAAQLASDSTSETQLRFATNTAARISNQANTALIFDTNATERMRIDSSGNVGIGDTNPVDRLTVSRLGSTWTGVAPNANTTALLHPGTTNSTSGSALTIAANDGASGSIYFSNTTNNNTGAINYSHTDDSMRFRAGNSERMRIDSTGNVGIGTDNPGVALDVVGATDPTIRVLSSGTGASDDTILRSQIGGTSASNYLYFGDADDNNAGQIRYVHSDDSMRFYAGATTERFRLYSTASIFYNGTTEIGRFHSNNYFGIGTNSPANNLHVNSTGNTVAKISSSFSGSTTTGLYIDTVGDTSAARLLFSKSGVTRGIIGYSHNATANSEAITFSTAGGTQRMSIDGGGLSLNGVAIIGGTSVSGAEGGEIRLTAPPTTSLSGDLTFDVQTNSVRFFESGGTNRGASLDITGCDAAAGSTIWHSGNDGSGSGLDADTLDGQQLSAFTLDNVCDRGSTTNQTITAGGFITGGQIQAGDGSGGVALTHNDGYGNSNVTFNHQSGTPEQAGNCGRIVVNTDSTTGSNMQFQVGDNSGTTAISLAAKMTITPTAITAGSGVTFSGDLSGNADSASTVAVTATGTSASYRMVFTDTNNTTTTTGNLYKDSASDFFYNPSTNTLTAGTFSGALSGNATTATSATSATNATNFNVAADNSTNATHYVIFTGGASGNQRPNSDTGLTYNPSTNTLTATTFSGALSGNATTATSATSATNATNINVAADNSTNATHYVIFTGGASGNVRPNSDTGLTYNPSTNTLTATTFAGNATSATTATTAGDAGTLDGLDSTEFIRSNAITNVTASTEWQDNQEVRFGNSADTRIVHNGTDTIFRSYKHGQNIYVQGENASGTNQAIAYFRGDAGVNGAELYAAGSLKLYTTGSGVTVSGTVTATTFSGNSTLIRTSASNANSDRPIVLTDVDNATKDNSNLYKDEFGGFTYNPSLNEFKSNGGTFADPEIQGNLLVGDSLDLRLNSTTATAIVEGNSTDLVFKHNSTGGNIQWQKASSVALMNLAASSGNLVVLGDVTAFGSPSDINLKENIEPISNAVEKVQKLDGVTFNYKKDGRRSTGLIAQQLEEVLPEVVYTAEDLDGEEHLAVRYGNTVGLLVEAIKELKEEIEELKAKLGES